MSFVVPADSYDRFMGRYSRLLAPLFADFAGVRPPQRALEVGSGPGALTSELVARLGAASVSAVDPSQPFAAAVAERHPGVEVRHAAAEALPFDDDVFDITLAQLVVHHMADPVGGVGEMARVTAPGGTVAACVWDLAGGRAPLSPFWRAVKEFDADAIDESDFPGAREGHLVDILETAGLGDVQGEDLVYEVEHSSFEEWWEPYTLGVGPAGRYVAERPPEDRERIEAAARRQVGKGPFTLDLRVWAARGRSTA